MKAPHLLQGSEAENTAEGLLKASGLTFVMRNFRCKLGEIDLIMMDKKELVFVEVRYRKKSSYGTGAESITRAKIRKLCRAAEIFLQRNRSFREQTCRFDVVSLSDHADPEWLKDAFTADDQ